MALSLDASAGDGSDSGVGVQAVDFATLDLPVIKPSREEANNQVEWLARLDEKVQGQCVWSRLNEKQ